MKYVYSIIALLLLYSCEYINSKLDNSRKKDTVAVPIGTTTTTEAPMQKSGDETVINVEPTLVRPQLYLMMKDWAQDEAGMHTKQDLMFNNLDFILVKNQLIPVGPRAAWHSHAPYQFIMEAGVPLDKKLAHNEPGTYYKETKRVKAVVAHFFGKRSLLPRAYDSLNVWLAENHQKAVGIPWEVYVSDPKVMKESDFLQTDVYTEAR